MAPPTKVGGGASSGPNPFANNPSGIEKKEDSIAFNELFGAAP